MAKASRVGPQENPIKEDAIVCSRRIERPELCEGVRRGVACGNVGPGEAPVAGEETKRAENANPFELD